MLSVIMAGGSGQRFWPRSRQRHPKQLINLTGQGSMISVTVERMRAFSRPEEIIILTNVTQAEAIARDVDGEVPRENIIGEPVGRNTAPSIGLAAVLIERRFGDKPFMVLPADHLVSDLDIFERSVRQAEAFARDNDSLLTFGITPTRPETGYGYIRAGETLSDTDGVSLFRADSFHEKPSIEKAREFLGSGDFFWNSGMFLWRPRVILEAIQTHLPDLDSMLLELAQRLGTESIDDVLKSIYGDAPKVSIDYGVMEKADNVVVVRGDFYWNDVGSWESIREMFSKDKNGNVLVGDHIVVDGKGNTVFSPDRLVGVVGLEDVVVVDSGDAILVAKRDRVQQVRDVVEALKRDGKDHLT
ncbi:MAG: NTP transferase domain-containing protein [Candidatus Latescibacterota bacterium]|nr:MAG: NTP transferase domain-containing protein [Candidatus Latescibacterota bacterium]